MQGSDGRKKYFVDAKLTIYACIFIVILVIGICLINRSNTTIYTTCAQYKAHNQGNFQKGDPRYNISMDADKDGYSCEL